MRVNLPYAPASGPAVEPVTLAEVRAHLRLPAEANYAVGTDTQTCTLPEANTYTLEVAGTGSVAVAAGSAVGTGWGSATAAGPVTFYVTQAGTVTLTVTEAAEDPGPPLVPAEQITAITLTRYPSDDTLLTDLVIAARLQVEKESGCALVTQEWVGSLDAFPPGPLQLGPPPVQSVEAVNYVDANGASQVLDPTLYQVDVRSWPARVVPVYGTVWPSTGPGVPNAVTVEFTSGFGATGADVPRDLRSAVLLTVGELYESREAASEAKREEVPLSVARLCSDYRARAGRF